ncbi:MAG: ATP-binding protein [Desulfobulbaceae bacterium]|nr:ATP-binding protein [Desulfobulbaceae bacterium]
MIGIRQKIMFGFGGLLVAVAAIGMLTMAQIDDLGNAIDVILKENYRSVVACQDMKEALERMDSGILFTLAGNQEEGNRLIEAYTPEFRAALERELDNITLPGERERMERIKNLFADYTTAIPQVTRPDRPAEARRADYFSILQPLFTEMKEKAQEVLLMNQTNMNEANNAARRLATTAQQRMLAAIITAAFLALLFSHLVRRWILRPINRLIESTTEIRRGNLDLGLEASSGDEIGLLSQSFNEMTAALRQVRKKDRVNLMRTRLATEEVFKALPTAIAVLDLEGRVELATRTADRDFGFKPGILAADLGYAWLLPLIRQALDEGRIIEGAPLNGGGQRLMESRQYLFQPLAVPIPLDPEHRESTGVALILEDVTQGHEQLKEKLDVVSAVSHQLKTPLTSLGLSVHLLLEERIGPLNDKQTELLLAARDDSEKLVRILDGLLDLIRIESGKTQVSLEPVSPQALVRDAIEPFLVEAREKGVTMVNDVPDDLPEVMADAGKIRQVFADLLSNALRFTSPGGSVTARAYREPDQVAFFVEDTGKGIAPEHLSNLFEQFYRVPGQEDESGVGLGLSMVREIIRAHGGEVNAASEIGKGSIFRFTLPLGKTPDKPQRSLS